METLTLARDFTSSLTYFAAIGLATVVEEELGKTVLISYSQDTSPKAQLQLDGITAEDVAKVLHGVAGRWAESGSWVQETMDYPEKKSSMARSPFSPRIKVIEESATWEKHQDFRGRHLDRLLQEQDMLAIRFIQGLGESAYWRFDKKDRRPDHGASRWEMKTRNKGQEFIKDRLALLCQDLATWEVRDVLDGLRGEAIRDTIGKNAPDSRTATGFTQPGPTDEALAFAGLLGLTAFPPAHQISGISVTPGAFPRNVLHTRDMVLPIPAKPVTLQRLVSLLLSKELATVSRALLARESGQPLDPDLALAEPAATTWLQARRVPAVAHWPVLKTGSSSAPERQVLDGTVVVL